MVDEQRGEVGCAKVALGGAEEEAAEARARADRAEARASQAEACERKARKAQQQAEARATALEWSVSTNRSSPPSIIKFITAAINNFMAARARTPLHPSEVSSGVRGWTPAALRRWGGDGVLVAIINGQPPNLHLHFNIVEQ